MTTNFNLRKTIIWIISIAIPLLIFLIPTSELFNENMRLFLSVTVFAILMIATENIPTSIISLLLPASYILFGLADPSLAWQPWTLPVLWMIIGGILLVNVLDSSGLLTRISYKIIVLVGGTYKGIIFGIGVIGIVLNLIAFGNAYMILAGLAVGLCNALNLEKHSKEATGIFLASAVAAIISSVIVYGQNIFILEGMGSVITGETHISWLNYTFQSLPSFLYTFAALGLIVMMFKETKTINSKDYFEDLYKNLGPLTLKEKKATFWVVLLLGYTIIGGILNMDITWAFVIIPVLMLLPGVGCGTEDDVKRIDFSFILFVATCLSIGFVAGSLGFDVLISHIATPLTQSASPTLIVFIIYVLTIVLNFVMTPLAIYAAFTAPFVQIAMDAGINPYVIYNIMSLGADQIIFPYEYALYLFFFSFGFIKMKDFMKYFGAKMILCSIMLLLITIPFWKLTGFFFV